MPHEDRPYLPHLIRFCFTAVPLQIDALFDAIAPENMMTAARTFIETRFQQQTAQFIEPDVGVGASEQAAEPRAASTI